MVLLHLGVSAAYLSVCDIPKLGFLSDGPLHFSSHPINITSVGTATGRRDL